MTNVLDTPVAPLAPAIIGSLSPSRAADFKACPLLYRFRAIDRIPEPPSAAATRGTMVHAVLERLFDLPASERTLVAAEALLPGAWQQVLEREPAVASLFEPDGEDAADALDFASWMASAADLLANYFTLEDPSRLEPAAREQLVEVVSRGLRLRGYVDRLDENPDGDLRIVDYKTGATPREAYEGKALFQMKFYALVLWRIRGVLPRQLRLIYLADAETLSYSPDAEELERFERTLHAIWSAIEQATMTGDFRPSPSRLCEWCDHHVRCPVFGGTPPPLPDHALRQAGSIDR